MEILIVDDEPLARQRLARMIESLETHHILGEADNADSALKAIEEFDPEVVLLDVRMPGKDGLTLAHEISQMDCPPAIIFCTAFDQYALEAFGTCAVGYLLKPVKIENLQDALEKAKKTNRAQLTALQPNSNPPQRARAHISAKTRKGIELIPIENIRFFVADHKYVTVFHTRGEHLLDETLKELEQEFGSQFVRIHRNALVAIKHIEAIEKTGEGNYQVKLNQISQKPLVSRRHLGDLKGLLKQI